MSGKAVSHELRVRVIQCHDLGLQTKDIVKETGVNERSVRHLVAKYKTSPGNGLPLPRKPSGPTHTITQHSLRVLKRAVDANPTITAHKLKEENPSILGSLTVSSVSHNLKTRFGY